MYAHMYVRNTTRNTMITEGDGFEGLGTRQPIFKRMPQQKKQSSRVENRGSPPEMAAARHTRAFYVVSACDSKTKPFHIKTSYQAKQTQTFRAAGEGVSGEGLGEMYKTNLCNIHMSRQKNFADTSVMTIQQYLYLRTRSGGARERAEQRETHKGIQCQTPMSRENKTIAHTEIKTKNNCAVAIFFFCLLRLPFEQLKKEMKPFRQHKTIQGPHRAHEMARVQQVQQSSHEVPRAVDSPHRLRELPEAPRSSPMHLEA